jgi:RNA polymerase sigma factor (sigma-70 family)
LGDYDLEDHIHNVFLELWQSILCDKVRQPECFKSFLVTVTHRYVLQVRFRRDRWPVEQLCETIDPPAAGWESDWSLTDRERSEVVGRALEALRPIERYLLFAFYVDDRSTAEMREEMGWGDRQLRVRKWRAKERFAELVRRLLRGSRGKLKAIA